MGACVRIPVVAVVASPAPYQNLALPPVRHLADSQTRPLPASVSGKLLSSPGPNNRLCPTPRGVRVAKNAPSIPTSRDCWTRPLLAYVCGIQPGTPPPSAETADSDKAPPRLCLWVPTVGSIMGVCPAAEAAGPRCRLCGNRWFHRSVYCDRAAFPQLPHVESLLGRRHCPGLGSCVTFAEPRWRHSRLTRPATPFNFFQVRVRHGGRC
jgi:hypothetical protein